MPTWQFWINSHESSLLNSNIIEYFFVLLCTCFAMSTNMAANCKPPIVRIRTLIWISKVAFGGGGTLYK